MSRIRRWRRRVATTPRSLRSSLGPSTSRARIVIVVLAAVAAAVFGGIRLVAAINTPAALAASRVANLDDLAASVTTAAWTAMDHDMSSTAPGYQMPPAMMPGMPTDGDQRLAVTVTVTNTSDGTRPLRPTTEFVLRGGKDGRQWTPHSGTFGELPRLAPHNAVSGVLFFDLPPAELADSPAWIEWTHGGVTTGLTVPLDGVKAPPDHSHRP